MDVDDICFITPIELNKTVVLEDGSNEYRRYLDELLRCIESWRRRAGWLKDIKMYAFNLCGYDLDDVIDKLTSLNVDVIDFARPHLESNGFMYEPLCGKLFESGNFSEKISIKIDMDMVVIKPIDRSLIEIANEKIVVGQYDAKSMLTQRNTLDNAMPFDTNFIIANKDMHFYSKYYDTCVKMKSRLDENDYQRYFLDEYVVDELYRRNKNMFFPVQNYQYGDGYPSILEYDIKDLKNVLFLHRHIKPEQTYNINKEIMHIVKAQLR